MKQTDNQKYKQIITATVELAPPQPKEPSISPLKAMLFGLSVSLIATGILIIVAGLFSLVLH